RSDHFACVPFEKPCACEAVCFDSLIGRPTGRGTKNHASHERILRVSCKDVGR
ncbi:hypothetical protein MTO96_034319, partial [Rhipicephalus appendiculatus]